MSFRLVIDGNAVYEIDEDCEKCGTRECRAGEKQDRAMVVVTDVGEENQRKQDEQVKQREPSS